MSSDFVRTAMYTAVNARITPMPSDAMPSKIGRSKPALIPSPIAATARPSIAAVSSKSTTNVVGSFAARIAAGSERRPWNARNSRYASHHATPSNAIARPSTTKLTIGFSTGSGCIVRCHPSYSEMPEPSAKIRIATTNDQK